VNAQDASAESSPDLQLEIAYFLLIDVVGYSKLLVNEQVELLQELNRIVRSTECFWAAVGISIAVAAGDASDPGANDAPAAAIVLMNSRHVYSLNVIKSFDLLLKKRSKPACHVSSRHDLIACACGKHRYPKLRIPDNVDEQTMCDLELNFLSRDVPMRTWSRRT
jgi:hypothetical protein